MKQDDSNQPKQKPQSKSPRGEAIQNRVIAVADCVAHERNYNKHPESQIVDLAESLVQFGQVKPIVVQADKSGQRYTIVAGHGVWLAAQRLGWKNIDARLLPVSWRPSRVLAYLAADNELARRGDPDEAQLAQIVRDIADMEGEALAKLAAGDEKTLRELLAQENASEETADVEKLLDKADELQKKWQVKKGDIWEIASKSLPGKAHRLMCGDSLNADDVDRLMQGKTAALYATDPPYLIDYTGAGRPGKDGKEGGKNWSDKYHEVKGKERDDFLSNCFLAWMPHLAENAAWFIWHAHRSQSLYESELIKVGIHIAQQIIWVKPGCTMTFSIYAWQHEPCYFGWKKGKKPFVPAGWYKDQSHTTVWQIDFDGMKRMVGNAHPTQKPIEIFARPMRNHTRAGDLCAEPFSGSGTQLVAGEMNGRLVYAMELEPAFVSCALERLTLFGLECQRVTVPKSKSTHGKNKRKDG